MVRISAREKVVADKRLAIALMSALASTAGMGGAFDSSLGRPMDAKMRQARAQERAKRGETAIPKAKAKRERRKYRNRNTPF